MILGNNEQLIFYLISMYIFSYFISHKKIQKALEKNSKADFWSK